ncbi:RcnB family protein [Sphingomonas bacterium]|uniref:RcnB family protein n=1 Tax=Sphingomonas bacterium TaxID=1895847 RepID=UPI0015763E43|nr:RcnB family protein [Sphingomonas bacterium]
MRSLLIATAAIAAMTAGQASAQRMIAHGPGAPYATPNQDQTMAPPPPAMTRTTNSVGHPHGDRWGSKVGGRWWAGANAPGGWNAYRQPRRGSHLPGYWNSSRFYITDWADYGLSQPPYGYNWARYYDDAVLIDDRGSVYDTVGGLDWDGYGDGYAGNETVYSGSPDAGYAQGGAVQQTYGQSTYAPDYDRHRSSGVGGAIAGAAVGGIAGNLIAGRGNRLGGTLIGAGVGGIAGYAIDRGSSGPHRPRYGADYGQPPVAPAYAPPPPSGYAPPPPPRAGWVSPDGTTTVTTTTGGYNGGGSTTTVVVQSAPVVTTTTTEIYEDAVTYTPPHKVWRKRVWHKPVWHKPACGCR